MRAVTRGQLLFGHRTTAVDLAWPLRTFCVLSGPRATFVPPLHHAEEEEAAAAPRARPSTPDDDRDAAAERLRRAARVAEGTHPHRPGAGPARREPRADPALLGHRPRSGGPAAARGVGLGGDRAALARPARRLPRRAGILSAEPVADARALPLLHARGRAAPAAPGGRRRNSATGCGRNTVGAQHRADREVTQPAGAPLVRPEDRRARVEPERSPPPDRDAAARPQRARGHQLRPRPPRGTDGPRAGAAQGPVPLRVPAARPRAAGA